MHGRKGQVLKKFEDVLTQYEPMITASMRNLNIYRDHVHFRQIGRIGLWQAWTRYDEDRGHFAPYASQSIRGAMLDELKKETRFTERVTQTEDILLEGLLEQEEQILHEWSDRLTLAFEQLTKNERQLIQWFFIEGLTQAECAEKAKISVAGIKKRRERMLVKLRKQLVRKVEG